MHPGFLGYAVCYRADEIQEGPIMAQGWHQHDTDQFLIPLRGQFRLELRAASGITSIDLVLGKQYKVSAGQEHQVLTSGGLLESFLLEPERPKASTHAADETWLETGQQQSV